MNDDQRARYPRGIVCSVENVDANTLRLVLDDVALSSTGLPRVWKETALFTSKEFSRDKFASSDLSDDDLIDIGLSVVARLSALTPMDDV